MIPTRTVSVRHAAVTAAAFVVYVITSTPWFSARAVELSTWIELGRIVGQTALLWWAVRYLQRHDKEGSPVFGLQPPSVRRALTFFVACAVATGGALALGYEGSSSVGAEAATVESARETYQRLVTLQARYGALWWLGVLAYGVVNPLAEELLFRVLMVNTWRESVGTTAAAVLSAVVFALTHIFIYGYPAPAFLFFVLVGLVLAAVYLRTGSVWLTLSLHVGGNFGNFVASAWITNAS